MEREVFEHSEEHEHESIAAQRPLERRVETLQSQVLLEDEGEWLEERMSDDLLLDVLGALLC